MGSSVSSTTTASRAEGLLSILAPAYLLAALLLGGATRGDVLSSGAIRLLGVPVLALALVRLAQAGLRPGVRWPLAVLAAAALLPLLQLIPLPPGVWTHLPGHKVVADSFQAAGVAVPWMPLSLAPWATLDAWLGLIPPAAAFLATMTLGETSRRRVAFVIVAGALLGTLLGVLQVTSGADSSLRLYEVTNTDSAVGFFANRNHYADLLAVALPVTAYWLAYNDGRSRGQRAFNTAVAVGLVLVLLVSLAVAKSRAGIGLGVAGLVASAALLWFSQSVPRIVPALLVGGMLVSGGLIAVFALDPILARFHETVSDEARVTLLPGLFAAARTYFPFGSGLGSFVPVFQLFETPDTVLPQIVNHAHNDYLELWIETGLIGAAVILAGLAWFATAAFGAWAQPSGRDADLPRVAVIVVAIILVHSAVDYPLRTAAMLSVLGAAMALLTPPPAHAPRSRRRAGAPANDAPRTAAPRLAQARPYVTTRSRRA